MSDYQHIKDGLASIGAVHPHYHGVTGNAIECIESLQRDVHEYKDAEYRAQNQLSTALQRIESLQRENEELKARAIPPEMRERIKSLLDAMEEYPAGAVGAHGLDVVTTRQLLRDLWAQLT